jgi:serine/threonine protein kinase
LIYNLYLISLVDFPRFVLLNKEYFSIIREAMLLSSLKHQYILQFLGIAREDNYLNIVYEFYPFFNFLFTVKLICRHLLPRILYILSYKEFVFEFNINWNPFGEILFNIKLINWIYNWKKYYILLQSSFSKL